MRTAASSASSPRERIEVRRMDFVFTPDIPDDWADDNALLTALLAGLSASFPPGERYFIESVRHFAGRVEDPELEERIRGFIGQEANHTKEHLAFNAFLDARGLPVKRMERVVERVLAAIKKRNSPEENLARTVALEHLTAFLASALLENPGVFTNTHPTIVAFWAWHAIEEIEHRAVAFDVFDEFVGDEWLRLRTMAVVTVLFSTMTAVRTLLILRATGNLFNVPAWSRGLQRLFGRTGMMRKSLPVYLAFYRKGFHPDEHDNRDAVERAKRKYIDEWRRTRQPS